MEFYVVGYLLIIILEVAASSKDSQWKHDIHFVEGSFLLSPDSTKKTDKIKNLMEVMGFKEDEITSYQEHPTAGNFGIKVLAPKKNSLEITTETPNGKHSMKIDGFKQKVTLWNGRELEGRVKLILNAYGSQKKGAMELSYGVEDEFGCTFSYRFSENDEVVLEQSCTVTKDLNSYKAELKFKRGVPSAGQTEAEMIDWGGTGSFFDNTTVSDYEHLQLNDLMDFPDNLLQSLDKAAVADEKLNITMIEGGWEMTSDRNASNVTEWLTNMDYYNNTFVALWKRYNKSGNFEIKVLDNDQPRIGIKWFIRDIQGEKRMILTKDVPKKGFAWDGRKLEVEIENVFKNYNSPDENSRTIVMRYTIQDNFQCFAHFRFEGDDAQVAFRDCVNLGKAKAREVNYKQNAKNVTFGFGSVTFTYKRYSKKVDWRSRY